MKMFRGIRKISFYHLFIIIQAAFFTQLYSQTIQTFPTGFYSLSKAEEIVPEYKEALSQASQLVGQIGSATGYLFYNEGLRVWEVHTAYHVISNFDRSLTFKFNFQNSSKSLDLSFDKLISTPQEHSKDRARFYVDYDLEPPSKISFTPEILEPGLSTLIMGFPGGSDQIKISLGHLMAQDDKGFWASTATVHPGSSGSPLFILGSNGKMKILTSLSKGIDINPFALVSYQINKDVLPTLLSIADYNDMLSNLSKTNKTAHQSEIEARMFFSTRTMENIDRFNSTSLPDTPGFFLIFGHESVRSNLKDFLMRAKLLVEEDPHMAANEIKREVNAYFLREQTYGYNKINFTDFPLLSNEQWKNISPNDLKPVLLKALDQSIENLNLYKKRLERIQKLFKKDSLVETIKLIKDLNLLGNEGNFNEYIIPMISLSSPYVTE